MKTAMQELIEHIDIEMKQKGIIPNWDMYLEKEKEQIENAYWASYKEGQYSGDKTAEEYYNQTYIK
jgi:hypothetical protein